MQNKVVCHDIYQKTYEVDADKLTYRLSIYGILIENNKVLLSKQHDGYEFPGGGASIDETMEQALQREFFEETGLRVELLQPVHCQTSFFHPAHSKKHKNEFWNCPLIYFLVKKVGGELTTKNFDEEEKEYADLAEWIDLSDIDKVKFINTIDTRSILKRAAGILR